MRPVRALAAAIVLFASLPARGQAADTPQIEQVPQVINALLRDYSHAYLEKDDELLTTTVGPGLVDRERKALANATDVPFVTFRVETTTQFSGDLASQRVSSRYRGREARTFHVIVETKVGPETGTYREDGAFTFVREPRREGYDGWRLVAKNDLDELGFFSPRHLWDEGKVSVLESKRFVLLTHPDIADDLRKVLETAERSYDRAARFWPGPQTDRYVIIVPSSTAELDRIMHETVDLEKFVAFVAAGADRRDGWEPTGPRMFVHLDHLNDYGTEGQTQIIAHELIHAITRPVSGPNIPSWVEEGLANLGGGTGGRASLAHAVPVGDDFPSQERFVSGPVRQIQATYDQAQVAIEVLVDEFGERGLADLYEELGKQRVVAGTETYHLRRAVEASVGWTYGEWVAAWRKRLG